MTQTPENGLTLEVVADDLETVKSIMFTLARQYERIDRTLDRTATQQEINTQAIAQINQGMMQINQGMTQTNQGMTRMTQAIAQLVETSTQQWQITQQILAEIREMQAEVRGLQVENRRILQRVFGTEEE